MDVPESIDVILNVMPPVVFWKIVISVVISTTKHLTKDNKMGRYIPNRTPLGHPGLQSSSKEFSATNTKGTVLGFTE